MRLLMFLLLACRAPADPSLPPGYRVAQAEVREGPFTNRLALATSPYLVQHAHDPVDWRPWGPEALAVAAERDVPVFLSIGYAACHWCHVMQHESFQDPDVAAFLNERFVPVKLDREERPDVDAVYMDAVYALNRGRGGWPASLWLTPQGEPFFAGTYYPPTAGRGRPGFRDVLEALDTAWRTDRASVIHDASRLAEALRAASVVDRGDTPGAEAAVAALRALVTSWDDETQGWGTRKFPMAPRLEALLAYGITTEDPASLRVVRQTLHAMDRGGIHDQIGGGFHRYTVDPRWRIPHFEKMLYDNGQLLGVYAAAAVALDEPRFAEVADGIATWMLRELVDPRTGAFASSQDADTEGVEGLTYTWTPEELRAVLGDDAGPVMAAYGVTEAGTFDEGRSVLIRVGEVPDDRVRARLLEARRRRPQPRTDTKLVVSYNALAIGGLARAGRLLERPGWVTAARAAADAILAARDPSGRLPRTLAPDAPAGVLDDYAMLADALVELHEADGDPRWLREADAVVAAMDRILWNDASGTWNHSAATDLIVTRTELTDGPEPAGAAVAARIHARLSALGAPAARPDRVEATLGAGAAHFGVATPTLAWTRLLIDRPAMSLVVAVDDPADAAPFRALWSSTWRPRGVFAVVGPDGVDGFATLADKSPGEAGPRAFLCEGGVCQAPADDVATVADQLATLHDAAIRGAEVR